MRQMLEADLVGVEVVEAVTSAFAPSGEASQRHQYLSRILSLIEHQDRSAKVWRDHLDPWFAHTMGGGFLARTGNLHTFDSIKSDDPARIRRLLPALNRMHWMSEKARLRLTGAQPGIVVKDHTYPIWAIRDRALSERPDDFEALHQFLLRWYRVAVLTKEQHSEVSGEIERTYVARMEGKAEADLSKYDGIVGAPPNA